MTDDRHVTEQALDLLVYGPVGLALYLRDTAPSFLRLFVACGRAVLDEQRRSVQGQLGNARAVGEFATNQGGPHLLRVVQERIDQACARVEETLQGLSQLADSGAGTTDEPAAGASNPPAAATTGVDASAASGLAIPDYDALSASQVVTRLDGLSPAELAAVRDYEQGHRARNTVLGKLDELTLPAD